jgi:hypothetical protein
MRALSSSVDFFVPVATTVMPKSCSAETIDPDFTPPVFRAAFAEREDTSKCG